MSRILIISDSLYTQLEAISHERGLNSIEELLTQSVDTWQAKADELQHRQETVQRINALRERLFLKYGEQADSVNLIRADRER
jgi:hypothetical protein